MFYHMHPNRRLKKMLYLFPRKPKVTGPEARVPFFAILVNKVRMNNKERFVCVYVNLYTGGTKVIPLKFTTQEDAKGVRTNIKELQKVIKMVKLAFSTLHKDLRKEVDFYQQ